jgi:stage II sporulation protein AB (anti-sigma F factor)
MNTTNDDVITIKVPALAKWGGVVRDAVYAIALRSGLTVEDSEDLRLSVGEAFNNAVQYAYGGESIANEVLTSCLVDENALEIILKDFGRGFTADDKPASNEVGIGLGLTFIESLMDETRIDSVPGKGTAIHMIKKLPA